MIEFFRNNSAIIPFAVCAICNFWVGIDCLLGKKEVPLAMAFLSWAAASSFMCWHYLTLPGNE